VDDCSTDGTPAIAEEYEAKDPRVQYYRNDVNLQLPRNLNRGFSLAKGDYLTWTSDDNRYRSQALEKMAAVLDGDPEAQFVFASCRIIDDEGKEIEHISVTSRSPRWVVGINPVGACFLYTRRVYEEIGEYDPDLKLVEDFDYWQRICARFKAVGVSEILYDYRWHAGALTSTMRKDLFYANMEKTLLKNRDAFGKLTIHQSYLYYKTLHECRAGKPDDPYKAAFYVYQALNFAGYRVPRKLAAVTRRMKNRKRKSN
jgi:glycosyltransferase involved in cell wall biosynthesis